MIFSCLDLDEGHLWPEAEACQVYLSGSLKLGMGGGCGEAPAETRALSLLPATVWPWDLQTQLHPAFLQPQWLLEEKRELCAQVKFGCRPWE